MENRTRLSRGRLKVYLLDIFCTIPYYLGALCSALRKAGVDSTLGSTSYYQDCCHFRDRGLKPEPGLLDFVAWVPNLKPAWRRPLKFFEGLLNLGALTIRFAIRPPDVLHVEFLPLLMRGMTIEIWFLRFCRLRGMKIVYTVHDHLPHDTGNRHWKRFHTVYHFADALICHSRRSKEQVMSGFGIPDERIRVIPHGPLFVPSAAPDPAAARARLHLSPHLCLVLCQGIIKPYKGIPFLLDAWERVLQSGRPCLLMIVGTGEDTLLQSIRERVAALSRPDSVLCDFRFVSEQELSDYYDAADILVYPYREITTSGALLTGLARRKPIVSTKCPAFVELLRHGESALFVDYDDAAQLAAALEELMADPGRRDRLAQRSQMLLSGEISWDAIAEKTKKCYEALAQDRSA